MLHEISGNERKFRFSNDSFILENISVSGVSKGKRRFLISCLHRKRLLCIFDCVVRLYFHRFRSICVYLHRTVKNVKHGIYIFHQSAISPKSPQDLRKFLTLFHGKLKKSVIYTCLYVCVIYTYFIVILYNSPSTLFICM